MNKKQRNRKSAARWVQTKGASSVSKDDVGFASSKTYVQAVTKIYHQEMNDIVRFVKFAESYAEKSR